MAEIFVEQRDGEYVALRNKRTVARGATQATAAQNAHERFPDDTIFLERVREVESGGRDKWRRWR